VLVQYINKNAEPLRVVLMSEVRRDIFDDDRLEPIGEGDVIRRHKTFDAQFAETETCDVSRL
jgi:hypothetical protein